MVRVLRQFLLIGVGLLILAAGIVVWLLQSRLSVQRREVLFVPEGETIDNVVTNLEARRAIRFPWLWRLSSRVVSQFLPLSVKMGSYELMPDLTHAALFENLLRGRNRLIRRFTISEGETVVRIAGMIARCLDEDSVRVLRLLRSDTLAQAWGLGSDARSLEGYLMPATYDLFEQEPVPHALKRIVRHFEHIWALRFADRAAACGLSRYQVLTLASIVEGEVRNPSEYRRIAGVYWNRLRRGMKLEADPTVQYAVGFPARRLTYRDYRVAHPYNTYYVAGLPPGPIKAPSTAAIDAVLDPEQHDYLYFCSIGDSSGTHRFARSYTEHKNNVLRYYQALQEQQRIMAISRAKGNVAGTH